MNVLENRMINILKELKEKNGAIAVRAEFEAEGTRLDELFRLKEISVRAGLGLVLKIGGCESIRDMLESRIVGVNCLVAPMVESAYALRKYLQAIKKVFTAQERKSIKISCNIETVTACQNLKEMLEIPEISVLHGIVIGRVDLCFSSGKNEEYVNNKEITKLVREAIAAAKKKNLVCMMGGGLSPESMEIFKDLSDGALDYCETRKVCFLYPKLLATDYKKGILKALGFELLWLKNKATYYKGITDADKARLSLIEQKYLNELDSLI